MHAYIAQGLRLISSTLAASPVRFCPENTDPVGSKRASILSSELLYKVPARKQLRVLQAGQGATIAAGEPLGSQGAGRVPSWLNVQLRTTCTCVQLSLMHSLSACSGCQNGTAIFKPAGHFFWPIRPSSMLDTTSLSVLHQPFPSCKVEKFFN